MLSRRKDKLFKTAILLYSHTVCTKPKQIIKENISLCKLACAK
jgi:hypothetical protein